MNFIKTNIFIATFMAKYLPYKGNLGQGIFSKVPLVEKHNKNLVIRTSLKLLLMI